jgi:hypothetical protein
MSINLDKINQQKEKVINLKKTSGIPFNSSAQVVLALDYSGSMLKLYRDNTVQAVVEKILPFGLAFDDNGEVDTYIFETGFQKISKPITLKNLLGYVDREILKNYKMGGTNYAPVLEAIYNDFTKSKGLFNFFSKTTMEYPVYIIFITDGNNSDKNKTKEIVRKMSEKGFFIQFIGIGHERFDFLERLDNLSGRNIDNANFFKVLDISKMTDDELYNGLMNEYPSWYKQAKKIQLFK